MLKIVITVGLMSSGTDVQKCNVCPAKPFGRATAAQFYSTPDYQKNPFFAPQK
jgi:hypothetical protein